MTARVEVEDIATTKSEKLLAVVLGLFVLIGLLWVYFQIDVERDPGDRIADSMPPATDRRALNRFAAAEDELVAARRQQSARRRTFVDRREVLPHDARRGPGRPHAAGCWPGWRRSGRRRCWRS